MKVRRSEIAMAAGVSVCALGLVYAMLLAERTSLGHALQIAAPTEALPGAPLPLRAYLMRGIAEGDTPTLIGADVEVRLWRREPGAPQVQLSSGWLEVAPPEATEGITMEGTLEAPTEPGRYVLEALASSEGSVLASVAVPLTVSAEAEPASELGRLAPTLSHFALGPVTLEPSESPPSAFEARVEGGLCVPDQICSLVVDLGSGGYELRVEPGPSVRVVEGVDLEDRYARVRVRVSGSEGDLTLALSREGRLIARRSVRLPVALATPYFAPERPFVREGRLPSLLAPPPGRTQLWIDVARDGHFVRTMTLPPLFGDGHEGDPTGPSALDVDLSGLAPGLYRVQVRADAFPTESVTGRLVRIGPASEVSPPFDVQGPLAFAFEAAGVETTTLALPRLVSGLPDDLARIEAGQSVVRVVALAAMLIAAVLLVLAVLRRGIASDADAQKVLDEAGAEEDPVARRHQRMTLVLSVLALALALLTGVALIAARGLMPG